MFLTISPLLTQSLPSQGGSRLIDFRDEKNHSLQYVVVANPSWQRQQHNNNPTQQLSHPQPPYLDQPQTGDSKIKNMTDNKKGKNDFDTGLEVNDVVSPDKKGMSKLSIDTSHDVISSKSTESMTDDETTPSTTQKTTQIFTPSSDGTNNNKFMTP
jgi:hypothetical protein